MFKQLVSILQNISECFTEEQEKYLVGPKEDYNLTANSTFIDIGAGFGKPVFHASMQTGCHSLGVEIVPARVEYCIDFVFTLADKYDNEVEKEEAKEGSAPPFLKEEAEQSIITQEKSVEPDFENPENQQSHPAKEEEPA